MQHQQDSAEWILRTTRRILRDIGPKAAVRFLDSRGGPARWESAAREISRYIRQSTPASTTGTRPFGSPFYQVHERHS